MTDAPSLLQPEELAGATALTTRVLEQLGRLLLGQADLHRMVLAGILSRGHILLEGVPGVGKTALIRGLGRVLSLPFGRIQFTPDLMPGDILGTHILQPTPTGERQMAFQPGPIFTNILLADEINRASPKTQSAMLETMQERRVTLMGTTRELPRPFFVLASQNPIELEGTYPLPEAQIDRFLFRLLVHQVDTGVLERIITSRRRGEEPAPTWTLGPDELGTLFATMDRVYLPRAVARYIARLTDATHPQGVEATGQVRAYVQYGASPRAAIAMAEAARAHALVGGRPTVGFEDVRAVAQAVLNHRVILNYKARFDDVASPAVVDELVRSLDETGLSLPDGLEVGPRDARNE